MEEVERINVVIIYLQQQQIEFMLRHNLYIIKVDHSRNYYSYRGFSHIVINCRNRKQQNKKKSLNMEKSNSSQLGFNYKRFAILSKVVDNIF